MHIAVVSPFPPAITGIGQYGFHTTNLLARNEKISKISILHGANRLHQPASFPAAQYPGHVTLFEGWQPNHLDTGWQIFSRLRSIKPDLVWFNLGASVFGRQPLANLAGYASVGLTQAAGIPTVVTLHELPEFSDLSKLKAPGGVFSIYGARLLTFLATRSDVVCLTMQKYVDWLSTHLPGPVYRHIANDAYYQPEILPPPPETTLLFFSTFAPFKGLELLLEAFKVLQAETPGLRLILAGATHSRFPDYPRQLQNQYQNLTGVEWLGQVDGSGLTALFQRASIVVLPYEASTGSSSVLMQAAAWGRSIVASDLSEIHAAAREKYLEVSYFKTGQADSLLEALKVQISTSSIRQAQVEHNYTVLVGSGPAKTHQAYLEAFNLGLAARCKSNLSADSTIAP